MRADMKQSERHSGRQAVLRWAAEAAADLQRCAELVGDQQEVQALLDAAGDRLSRLTRVLRQELSPLGEVPLDPADLVGSLTLLVERASEQGAPAEFASEAAVQGALDSLQAGHVLQVAREALTNAMQHAGANRVAVRAEVAGQRLILRISDDGTGFDTRLPRVETQRGLSIMWQRAEALHGYLQVQSAPGAGTIVTLTVPLRGQV